MEAAHLGKASRRILPVKESIHMKLIVTDMENFTIPIDYS